MVSTQSKLASHYEDEVLPALFRRLDRAFPEIAWRRTATGWAGRRRSDTAPITCSQPWGYCSAGETRSWLAYVNGGQEPTGEDFVTAVARLGELAGVETPPLKTTLEQQATAVARHTHQQVMEAFVAFCQVSLASTEGQQALGELSRSYGFHVAQGPELPLGYYPSRSEVIEYLASLGFSDEQLKSNRLVTDRRLAGRIVIPWRDANGRLCRMVAHQPDSSQATKPIYWQTKKAVPYFGLDVATQTQAQTDGHLLMVDGFLDTVYCHTQGLLETISLGNTARVPTAGQWEQLVDLGITSITLAFSRDGAESKRLLAALDSATAAERAPRLFVLPHDALGEAPTVASYIHLHGSGKFRNLLSERIHIFRHVAETLIRDHCPEGNWSDANLVAALADAATFDAEHYTPLHAVELEAFFWPTVLERTGADWEAVRFLLRRQLDAFFHHQPGTWHPEQCQRLLRNLRISLSADDMEHFSALVWAAAHGMVESSEAVEVEDPKLVLFEPPEPTPVIAPVAPKAIVIPQETAPPVAPQVEMPLDVRMVAYRLWEQSGRPQNQAHEFWSQAEEIVSAQSKAA